MKFKVSQIQKMVEDSISVFNFEKGQADTEDYDYVINNLITPPKSQRYFRDTGIGFLWLWAVWDAGTTNSYQVVFDPRIKIYGLAIRPKGKHYGKLIMLNFENLVDAIRGM